MHLMHNTDNWFVLLILSFDSNIADVNYFMNLFALFSFLMFASVKSVMEAIYHNHLLMGFMSFSLFVMQEDALHTNNFLNGASLLEQKYQEH